MFEGLRYGVSYRFRRCSGFSFSFVCLSLLSALATNALSQEPPLAELLPPLPETLPKTLPEALPETSPEVARKPHAHLAVSQKVPVQTDDQASSNIKALFALKFKDEISLYSTFCLFAMPGEQILLEPLLEPSRSEFSITASGGVIEKAPALLENKPSSSWIWTAPMQPGLHPMSVSNLETGTTMAINAFVMVPAEEAKNGSLNGYKLGEYPEKPLKGNPAYLPPRGFIEVTEANRGTRLSPHFTLGEFVAKQGGGWPKYVALRERMLLKLELIIDELQANGYPASSLHVMSGYRTPYYNKRIGNGEYSRHQWGDAADIFVDESPKNGVMDDLNEDGKVSVKDAKEIYNLVNELNENDWYRPFIGGLGLYRSKPGGRGPFVHVDVRGSAARWGNK